MKKITLLFLFPFMISAQEKGDFDYVFQSIDEAYERPEIVYHLSLQKKKLNTFPEKLELFKNLKTLDLSKNKISLIPANIGNLTSLEELNLAKNKIYSLPPQLSELKNLRALHLSRNDIETIPAAIGELVNLEKIDLWDNNIKSIHPSIANLKHLKTADFRGMIFTEELIKNLKEWLPETKLELSPTCDCGI